MQRRNVLSSKAADLLRISSEVERKSAQVPSNVGLLLDPILKNSIPKLQTEIDSLIHRLCVLNGTCAPEATEAPEAPTKAPETPSQIVDLVMETTHLLARRLDRTLRMVPRGNSRKRAAENDEPNGLTIEAMLKKRRVETESSLKPLSSQAQTPCPINVPIAASPNSTPSRNLTTVFIPQIVEKPNALSPLDPELLELQRKLPESIRLVDQRLQQCVECTSDIQAVEQLLQMEVPPEYTDTAIVPHPYESEMEAIRLLYETGDDEWGYEIGEDIRQLLFAVTKLLHYEELEDSPEVEHIADKEGLSQLIDEVLQSPNSPAIVAVDLEHHSFESYRGQTCLMQLTFNNKDYVIDTLALPALQLNLLNQIFANPAILKVLHGSHFDVLWLQELAGLYLINVFDTYFASKLLKTPGGNSLAALVELYCNVKLDKSMQTSDWRRRPLTPKMLLYARSDTHYLPYIFVCMKNQLLTRVNDNDLVTSIYNPQSTVTSRGRLQVMWVLEQSRCLALNRVSYKLPDFAIKSKKIQAKLFAELPEGFDFVLMHLLAWRDLQARRRDVLPASILPDRILLTLAQKAPRTQSDANRILGTSASKFPKEILARILNLLNNAILKLPTGSLESLTRSPGPFPLSPPPLSSVPEIKTPKFSATLSPLKCDHQIAPDLSRDSLPIKDAPLSLPSIVLRGAFMKGRRLKLFTSKKTSRSKRQTSGLGKLVRAIFG
eukprot:Gregarina_sp_Poly_1__10664@NODE_802_length_6243_cov_119_277850_g585_i0_p1_GENE_NODE_802_length_6243_cov_119_277850_g585_i0NODE_802_length_6243_cov_119_277850_g585_i0_p1_ORF_typecomplete_len719_score98_34DNA_pol_A_exo1/PF01612_20/3_3e42HRDC/PF00570_23/1_1e09_NODE_802_length_6243_cov_119_277850_g585_i040146170